MHTSKAKGLLLRDTAELERNTESLQSNPRQSAPACYTQEFIDATVAGFTEQRDKPDASDAFKAEMQRGIDAIKGTCVKS